MTALFQPEISSIEAQIAQLQARLVAFTEAEGVADGVLQAVQGGVEKLSPIGAEAITRLKEKIIALFNRDDSGDGGNQTTTEPQPNNDDGGQEFDEAQALPWHELPFDFEKQAVVPEPDPAIAVQVEPLTGQFCEWGCSLEEAPSSSLQGQSVALVESSTVSDTPKEPAYYDLVPVSDAVAYFRNNQTGEIICCYVGFNNKTKAKQWGEFLAVHHSVASGFELRTSKRLPAFKHEIKLWGMSIKQIEKLAESNLQKSPPSNFGTAPKRKIEPVAPVPKQLTINDVEVGDTVRSTTVKHWSYLVLAKMENGMLDCERIGASHIRLAIHPGAVELVSRAIKVEDFKEFQNINIDTSDVPTGIRLERTNNVLITEYRVWAWVVVRVLGKPEVQQKCIGILAEGKQCITASRPYGSNTAQSYNRILDAIRYLMQGANLKLSDLEAAYKQHQSEVAIASIPAVTSEQAKADLFGGGYDLPPAQQQIEANDWVELLVNGDRYQVAEVDNEGIHLVTDDGNMLVQVDEIQLLMKIPATWQPFQTPTNWQPF